MTLADAARLAILALLVAACVFGLLTIGSRFVRRARERRRTRLAAPARRMLLALAAGDDDPDLVERLAAVEPQVWNAVEPAAVAMLGKVRGEAHAALVMVFVRRGAGERARRDLHRWGAVRRARAAEVLGNLGARNAVGDLCALLQDPDPDVRVVAARALGRIGDPTAAERLLHSVAGRRGVPPQLVAHALIKLGIAAQGEVVAALESRHDIVRAAAVEALGLIGAAGTAHEVERRLREDTSFEVRMRAVRALGRLGSRAALQPLIDASNDDLPVPLRAEAAEALGDLGSPAAAAHLGTLLCDPNYRVAHNAARALLKLGKKGFATLNEVAARPDIGAVPDRSAAHALEALAIAALEEERRAHAAAPVREPDPPAEAPATSSLWEAVSSGRRFSP
ncbi:hypothetical protein Val02_91200 [Virgisporangium aliadipatigenens]|uniref:HEAT repeat domain-containing protein n=1 Tax=Virgisporangium aliadipatigenens TaxID=741659 RepID=A0A8J3YUN9_9ACTN|nr:HEAT repeat domain-containing protein [Virgisporangium aliadipatigenens]GIJ52234.1 hypothetical protein Val02_91200 [Virgisporangium aliadipatigenens]